LTQALTTRRTVQEKLVLMKEQEQLDITHSQVTTLTDSLLGTVDEGSSRS